MNCSFVGHHHIRITRALERTVKKELKALIENGCADFYSGGAYGWDALCSTTILKLRKKYSHIRLHLILPCHASDYTAKWGNEKRALFYKIMAAADSIELPEKTTGDGLREQSKKLTDKADVLFCYYDKHRSGSPTERAVYTASQKGAKIMNMCGDGGFTD